MALEAEEKVSLDSKLADIALAYQLVKELGEAVESPKAKGRAALALIQIEAVGEFLTGLGMKNDCRNGVAQWQARKRTYGN